MTIAITVASFHLYKNPPSLITSYQIDFTDWATPVPFDDFVANRFQIASG
jgi:hypothetical protein